MFLPAIGEWLHRMAALQQLAERESAGVRSRLRNLSPLILWLTLLLAGSVAAQSTSPAMGESGAEPEQSGQASSPATVTAQQFTLEGKIKSGGTFIPGATITATNPTTKEKKVGWTRADGSYSLALPAVGEYVLRVEMVGFGAATQRVNVSPTSPHRYIDVQITLASRAQNSTTNEYERAGGNRGFQTLSVTSTGASTNNGAESNDSIAPAGMPVPGIPPSMATESVAVSGASASGNVFDMNSSQMRGRAQDFGNQQGGSRSARPEDSARAEVLEVEDSVPWEVAADLAAVEAASTSINRTARCTTRRIPPVWTRHRIH